MARKKQIKIPAPVVKAFLILAFICIIVAVAVTSVSRAFLKADYFKVKSVRIESSLGFINKNDIEKINGKNIFTVDLKVIKRQLSTKYPQMEEIRLVKEYPNQISIEAKKRWPLAQIKFRNKYCTLDNKAVVVAEKTAPDEKLPLIEGIKVGYARTGAAIHSDSLDAALQAISWFNYEKSLGSFKLEKINVGNSSKIYLVIAGRFDVIIDDDDIPQKIKLLGFMLSQSSLKLDEIKYIDLRFKEPVLGSSDMSNNI
jgi:cell division septal protein FtsQ